MVTHFNFNNNNVNIIYYVCSVYEKKKKILELKSFRIINERNILDRILE